MRHGILWTAAAVAVLSVFTTAARAQVANTAPAPVVVTAPVPAPAPAGVLFPMPDSPVIAPLLPPEFYAPEMLPNSASHPYVIMPRFNTYATGDTSFSYGYRSSPYGSYSRFNYLATGPFPGLPRPFLRADTDHCHHTTPACP